MHNQLRTIKVARTELLTKLRENLEKHTAERKEALELRRKKVASFMQMTLGKMEESEQFQPKENMIFPIPDDHTKEYQKYITMYEMAKDELILLDESQFDQMVMDNWGWKRDFLSKTTAYVG